TEVEAGHFRIGISFDEIPFSSEAEDRCTRNEVKLLSTRIARKSEKLSGAFDVRSPERVVVEYVVDPCAIMNDCVNRFRQLLPGAVGEPQSRARQVAADHSHPSVEGLGCARVVKTSRLQPRFQSPACRRGARCTHENCVSRTRLVKQAPEEEWPKEPGPASQQHLAEGAVGGRNGTRA